MKNVVFLAIALGIGIASALQSPGEDKPAAAPAPVGAPGPAFMAGQQQILQPVPMDPARLRQNMQARAEYDELNRRIMARTAKLYEENARIKELQAQLRELQTKIDNLLAQDEELIALKKEYETIAPEFPMGIRKGFATNTTPVSTNR